MNGLINRGASMSEIVDPIWLQSEVDKGELRLINLKAGHYYISKEAKIYSFNFAQPRVIQAIPKLSGEQIVILYTPSLTAYDLPELVLSAFQPIESGKQLYPCFWDLDPANCLLQNLYWGDENQSLKWRQKAYLTLRQRREEAEKAGLPVEQDLVEEEVVEPVPRMPRRTPEMTRLCKMIADTTIRLLSDKKKYVDDETQFVLRMLHMRFQHAMTRDYFPEASLRSSLYCEVEDPQIEILIKRFQERFEKVLP